MMSLGVQIWIILGGIGGLFGKIMFQAKKTFFQTIFLGIVSGIVAGILSIVVSEKISRQENFSISCIMVFVGSFLSIYVLKLFETRAIYQKPNEVKPKTEFNEKNQFKDYKINKIFETEITYEILGTEHRTIDNSNNNGHVKRKMTISREWKKTFNISESIKSSNEKIGKASFQFVELGLLLSNAIENKYDFQSMDTNTYAEEIELDILPQSKIILEIDWKIIWQNGLIELIDTKNNIVYYSYKIAKGLTFDQTQRKTN